MQPQLHPETTFWGLWEGFGVMGGFMGGLGEPEDHFLIFHGRQKIWTCRPSRKPTTSKNWHTWNTFFSFVAVICSVNSPWITEAIIDLHSWSPSPPSQRVECAAALKFWHQYCDDFICRICKVDLIFSSLYIAGFTVDIIEVWVGKDRELDAVGRQFEP